jgi:hypothetical protein
MRDRELSFLETSIETDSYRFRKLNIETDRQLFFRKIPQRDRERELSFIKTHAYRQT